MSKRLQHRIQRRLAQKQKLLSLFLTAGFPTLEMTADLILACDRAGVDFIELGMPFSDPVADGPVIQAASQVALKNGVTPDFIFSIVAQIRRLSSIPIILMGYLNPVFQIGFESFFERCALAGVDGLILPDWPPEEAQMYASVLRQYDLNLIHLIAPNTSIERIKFIDRQSNLFVYATAYTGITGQTTHASVALTAYLERLKSHLNVPFMVGFGIKSAEDFAFYSRHAAGCIVGSAFIEVLQGISSVQTEKIVSEFVRRLRPPKKDA